ncbi:MAG: S41 family peptidase [Clostridia bacterium]|nr:S41 family peptidase [Clostridia bacterium]
MNSKKPIIITAVVMFIMTTAFYLTPLGSGMYSGIKMLSGDLSFEDKMSRMSSLMEKYYMNEYDEEKMQDLAMSAYAAGAEDPYTNYINAENYTAMLESMGSDYLGIGVEVSVADGTMTIMSVFENSPAQKVGLQIGDKIVAVEGEPSDATNYQQAINTIKGVDAAEGDNDVLITILRGEEQFDLTITREQVALDTVNSKMLEGNIAYLHISDFGEKTFDEYTKHLAKLEASDPKGLIIDLRNNPGGMLTTVVSIADTLLPQGNILTIRDKKGNETPYVSDEKRIELPVVVLINQNSASASEVLAGAMRDYEAATLVGTKSYGKGVVQSLIEFGDGSAFKLTTAKYYTPSGECIDGKGIEPHVKVELAEQYRELPVNAIEYENDAQLKAAVQILKEKL